MTHELVLTSVSQGLEPDSQGFCVVAADRDIPNRLVKQLTSLSGYQHFFPPDSGENARNPVVYSHVIVPGPEASWHVLSRICDAGTDYRHEANHLAHHVALEESEFVEEGPAWLLALYGFHLTEWTTPSVRFSRGRLLPTLTAPPPLTRRQRIAREKTWLDPRKMILAPPVSEDFGDVQTQAKENEEQMMIAAPPSTPCPLWQEQTGDAGWGGVLAETIRTGQQVVLLYNPGTNLLPLFVEALALLPSEFLWKATFSTRYTRMPEHVPCQWKGFIVGSPEASPFLHDSEALVVDLTRPTGPAPFGPYVEYARHGVENMLPENETVASPFQADDFDTKTFFAAESASQAATEPSSEAGEKTDGEPLLETVPADSPSIPPVLVHETVSIRTRPPSQGPNVLGSVLNMKSRGGFYVLYGATLLFVLLLLVVVLDQLLDFGLLKRFRNEKPVPGQAVASKPDKASAPSPDKAVAAAPGRLSPDVVRAEQAKRKNEDRERARAEAQRKKELKEKVEQVRAAMKDRAEKDAESLDEFLHDFKTPAALALTAPSVEGRNVKLPESPQMFREFSPLYRYGMALDLNVLPLLDIPKVRVETKKLELFLDEAAEPDRVADGAVDEATASKLDAPPSDGTAPDETVPAETEFAESGDLDLRVPDTSRFEWSVSAVDTETENETPMFRLVLTEEGLQIAWERAAVTPQHFFDTLWTSLGFLRLSVVGEKNLSKMKSVALFEPKVVEPVFLTGHFADPEKAEYVVDTPLAKEPWKSLFIEKPLPYMLRLEVKIAPEVAAGVQGIEIPDGLPPNRFFANFQTEISSKKTVGTGSDAFSSVVIPFEGVAEPGRIVWSDRYNDRINLLKDEAEVARTRFEEAKREEDAVQKQIFNAGSATSPEMSEARKKRNELKTETKSLDSRLKEIEDILAKLPSARDKIIGNDKLRFEYSLFLVPVHEEREEGDEAEPVSSRLKSEESLLILKTESPKEAVPKEETQDDGKKEADVEP